MADLAATDWTYEVVTDLFRRSPVITNGVKTIKTKLTIIGNNVDTYPAAGGIPLSTTPSDWGFVTTFESINIYDSDAAVGRLYKFDVVNNSIRIFVDPSTTGAEVEFVELDSSEKPGDSPGITLFVEAKGW